MLFGKISYFIAFLLWIGKLELLHCQYILSGFGSYVFMFLLSMVIFFFPALFGLYTFSYLS